MSTTIYVGDCREVLRSLPDKLVHCCVTSPPYFGLRDYGVDGQMGLEGTPDEFVAGMVDVFREVRRVLRDDGTLWLNLGDSYAGNGGAYADYKSTLQGSKQSTRMGAKRQKKAGQGLKPKDLIGIPWRVAFALQADGWYLRQDIIWSKPNPMPESVRDRCTKAHEYLFLLSKSQKYYFDANAIKERSTGGAPGNVNAPKAAVAYIDGDERHRTKAGLASFAARARAQRDSFKRIDSKRAEVFPGQTCGTHRPDRTESEYDVGSRNKRSVWTVATQPFKEAHFATYPAKLIEPCILAGSPAGGVVLDPFGGAGTTAVAAESLGRHAVLIELNPAYAEIARRRIDIVQPGLALGAA